MKKLGKFLREHKLEKDGHLKWVRIQPKVAGTIVQVNQQPPSNSAAPFAPVAIESSYLQQVSHCSSPPQQQVSSSKRCTTGQSHLVVSR